MNKFCKAVSITDLEAKKTGENYRLVDFRMCKEDGTPSAARPFRRTFFENGSALYAVWDDSIKNVPQEINVVEFRTSKPYTIDNEGRATKTSLITVRAFEDEKPASLALTQLRGTGVDLILGDEIVGKALSAEEVELRKAEYAKLEADKAAPVKDATTEPQPAVEP